MELGLESTRSTCYLQGGRYGNEVALFLAEMVGGRFYERVKYHPFNTPEKIITMINIISITNIIITLY